MGSSIDCTRGVYPAELQAIARILAMFPLSFTLLIHSDSAASLAAIRTHEKQSNERKRMRMQARRLLQLISHQLRLRQAAGGSVQWAHVRAHTDGTDLHSVGNRLSDLEANRARLQPRQPKPLQLRQLPLQDCERHLRLDDANASGLQIIDDVRRSALAAIKSRALAHWQSRLGQGVFAGLGTIELGRVVCTHGSASQQATFVHVATNSIHYHCS